MSHGLSGLNRIIFFLLGLLLLVGGVWAVLWALDVPEAHTYGEYVDLSIAESWFRASWWPVALGVTAALAIILGLALLIANMRRHSFNRLSSETPNEKGEISVATTRVADGVGEDIARHPGVNTVKNVTKQDRGRKTITFKVEAAPHTNLAELKGVLETADKDIHNALRGIKVDTRYLVHLDPVSQD